jgi:hypothetical protein
MEAQKISFFGFHSTFNKYRKYIESVDYPRVTPNSSVILISTRFQALPGRADPEALPPISQL